MPKAHPTSAPAFLQPTTAAGKVTDHIAGVDSRPAWHASDEDLPCPESPDDEDDEPPPPYAEVMKGMTREQEQNSGDALSPVQDCGNMGQDLSTGVIVAKENGEAGKHGNDLLSESALLEIDPEVVEVMWELVECIELISEEEEEQEAERQEQERQAALSAKASQEAADNAVVEQYERTRRMRFSSPKTKLSPVPEETEEEMQTAQTMAVGEEASQRERKEPPDKDGCEQASWRVARADDKHLLVTEPPVGGGDSWMAAAPRARFRSSCAACGGL